MPRKTASTISFNGKIFGKAGAKAAVAAKKSPAVVIKLKSQQHGTLGAAVFALLTTFGDKGLPSLGQNDQKDPTSISSFASGSEDPFEVNQ